MDEDDPEKRIAELERLLAEHRRIAEPRPLLDRGVGLSDRGARGDVVGTPVSAESAGRRCFMATAPRMNMKSAATLVVYGGTAAMVGLPFALNAVFHVATGTVGEWMHWLILGAYGLLGLLFARSLRMRSFIYPKVSIRMTGDGLEVNRGRGRGEVFPLIGATLGPWAAAGTLMGTALPLRNARHRFVLGGQNYVPVGARLDAKPMWNVDAWMSAPDFGALLTTVYR